jgi:hypothetical protein
MFVRRAFIAFKASGCWLNRGRLISKPLGFKQSQLNARDSCFGRRVK